MFAVLVSLGSHALENLDVDLGLVGAIAWRILRTGMRTGTGVRSLLPVAVVVIESGAIYTSAILGVLLSYLSGSDGHYIAYDVVSPLVVSSLVHTYSCY